MGAQLAVAGMRSMSRLGLAALLLGSMPCAHALDFKDDSARIHTFSAAPQRVVTLAPSLTELVYAAGGGERLVATIIGSNHPPEARSVPSVGDYQRVDVERLLRLKPDVVLVWTSGNSQRELAQLTRAGVPVVHLEPRRLAELARAIERLGELFGTTGVSRASAQALKDELAALGLAHEKKAPVRVFYQVWSRPLLTLSNQHLISDVIKLCGGLNVFGGLDTLVPEVSTESVLAAKPEVIFSARSAGDKAEPPLARRDPDAPAFAVWRSLRDATPASSRGWLFTLPGDEISRQGPRIVLGARAVCDSLEVVRRER